MRKFWLTLGLVLTMLLVATVAGAEECTSHIPGFAYPYSSTEHAIYCFVENCDAVVGYEQHYNACNDDSSACDGCGATDVVIGFDTHGSVTYVNLGEEHQAKCDDCGMLDEKVRHEQSGYRNLPYTETEHQKVCIRCDAVFETEKHSNICTGDDSTCNVCNATGVVLGSRSHYTSSLIYVNIGYEHQKKCNDCGEVLYTSPHQSICTSPSTCIECGAENVEVEEWHIRHTAGGYVANIEACEYSCSDCGYTRTEPHAGNCDTPTTCYNCGTEGVTIDEDNLWHDCEYVVIDDTHQEQCVKCDYEGVVEAHWTFCFDDPNMCYECGTRLTPPAEQVYHINEGYVNLGDTHQLQCAECGYATDEEKAHSGYCDEPGVCRYCNAEGVTIAEENLEHRQTAQISIGDQHQWKCVLCGTPTYYTPSNHRTYCTVTDTCIDCGAPLADDVPRDVLHSNRVYTNLGSTHRIECSDCGFSADDWGHWALCGGSTSDCFDCGAPLDASALIHIGNPENITYDVAAHTFTCSFCSDTVVQEHSFDEGENACNVCGYVKASVVPGDVSGDNTVTTDDALALLTDLADPAVTDYPDVADVDNDNDVDQYDLLLLMQYLSGWDVELK